MERKAFGKLADGEEATLYTISNTKGMYAQITDFGASIVSLVVKDKDGKNTDVVLGYENAETYQQQMASFGAVVGRNCNRIANAEIVIDGVTYQLEKNDNENNLHSGSQATSRRLWDAEEQTADKITFVIKDAEGQQGYPGNAVMKVTYEVTEANELSITYHATADKTTIFNMTNHAYFNLNGARPVRLLRWMEHRLISGKQSRWAEILSRQMISFLTAMDTIIILFWIRSGQGLKRLPPHTVQRVA